MIIPSNRFFLKMSELFMAVFLFYINWFMEVYGDRQIILYSSVLMAGVCFCLSIDGYDLTFLNKVPVIVKTLFVFGIYSFIVGVLVAVDHSLLFSSMTTYFCFLVMLFICAYISNAEGSIRWLENIMLGVALLCAYQTVFHGVTYMNGIEVTTMGIKNNPNSLSLVMVFGVYVLIDDPEKTHQFFPLRLLAAGLLVYVTVLTGSRKCLVAEGLMLAMWVIPFAVHLIRNQKSSKDIFYLILLVVGMSVIIYYFLHDYINTNSYKRMIGLIGKGGGTEKRIHMYEEAMQVFAENPLFGVGFDQYRKYSSYGAYSHSTYAEVLSCGGVVGTCILLGPILYITLMMFRFLFEKKSPNEFLALYFIGIAWGVELFLGASQIWYYGFTHIEWMLCIMWRFEKMINQRESNNLGRRRCKYVKDPYSI